LVKYKKGPVYIVQQFIMQKVEIPVAKKRDSF